MLTPQTSSANQLPGPPLIADVLVAEGHSNLSALAWGAILAGAATAASLWMILMVLGAGLGLASVSPWQNAGIAASTFGIATIAWLVFSQVAASGMGGYIAGRLRTRWSGVPRDEVWFRDTAHGFLAWAVSALVIAALLIAVIGSLLSDGLQSGNGPRGAEELMAAPASPLATRDALTYSIDTLYRTDTPIGERSAPSRAVTAESGRIFTNALHLGSLPTADIRYIGAMVAQQTGLSQDDAQTRVADAFAQLQSRLAAVDVSDRTLAEQARKASATAALWLFISLLCGAFFAGVTAIFGGRQRDA